MKTSRLLRHLLSVVLFLPFIVQARSGYSREAVLTVSEEGGPVASNVPLNEISVRAYRFFHKEWPGIKDEVWYRTEKEFIVTFSNNSHRKKAFFSLKGIFLYSLEYYSGKEISDALAAMVKNEFPDYQIKVVTELVSMEKKSYFITIENNAYVKTLSFMNGELEVIDELINGDSEPGKVRD
jgi:hypothetical protein